MPHGMESPAATRAFPGRGLLIALVALLPLTLAWGPNLNIPPTMIVTGAGLDTAYSSPASDSLEGEWLLGIRAFSTRIHFDDPVQLVWYGATAEIMRGFSSENYRFGAAIQGGRVLHLAGPTHHSERSPCRAGTDGGLRDAPCTPDALRPRDPSFHPVWSPPQCAPACPSVTDPPPSSTPC